MLLVYGDGSLDETQDRVCAVAGVIGTEEQWEWIEPIWVERTDGISFHANHCDSDQEDYAPKAGENPDEVHTRNKTTYKDLTILLAKSGLGGFASAIDLAAQRRTFPAPDDPPLYYQGFMDVLEKMRSVANDRGEMAKFTFDRRIESRFNATEIYAYLLESGLYWSDHLASKVEFESSRTNPRIQVADLLAREAMKYLDNKVGPVKRDKRRSWECLRGTGRFRIESHGVNYFRRLGEKREILERVLGIGMVDYAKWLESNRVPACYTSYLRFLFWKRKQMAEEQLKQFADIFREH
jgi:hypothetical protein